MRIIRIPKKKSGQFRLIYIPNDDEKSSLRSIVGQLTKKAAKCCPEGVPHGFMKQKSPITNALAHVGHQYTTCFDLKDFFDSVTETHLKGKLTKEELSLVLVDGAARQGLPTSPAVSNIAAGAMDKAILGLNDKLQFVYTRYADDLTFSYDDINVKQLLLQEIPKIVRRCGFKINESKTRTMSAKNGRRIITGIAVDNEIHAPRRVKRRLRAALHQNKLNAARGLAEYCLLKPPKEKVDTKTYNKDDISNLLKVWKLGNVSLRHLPEKTPLEDLGDNCIITPDPVYMLGMSTLTTGWASCMKQPNGSHRKGAIFWMFLRGTRIATLLSDKVMRVANVERKVMRARTLVHQLRNGALVYDRIYGNPNDTDILREKLRGIGYISIGEARCKFEPGIAVVGHAPARWLAYFDNLSSFITKASAGPWKGRMVRVVKI